MGGRSLQRVSDGDRGAISSETAWRTAAFVAIGFVMLFAWLLLRPDSAAEPDPVVSATPTPVESTPEPTATPTPTPTPMPTPIPTPTQAEGTTVLFNGGPATGPWQQIGSVAEITHPDAPDTASFAYREFWSDPEGENQPDWLWDQITAEVMSAGLELGAPVDRPVFGGEPGSESFNSFAGVQDVDEERRLLTAVWIVTFEDADGPAKAYFGYLLSFDNTVLEQQGPLIIRESDQPLVDQAGAEAVRWLQDWSGVS